MPRDVAAPAKPCPASPAPAGRDSCALAAPGLALGHPTGHGRDAVTWRRAVTDHKCLEKGSELCPARGWHDAGASYPLSHGILEYPGVGRDPQGPWRAAPGSAQDSPKVTPCVVCPAPLQPGDSLERTSTAPLPLENPRRFPPLSKQRLFSIIRAVI